MTPEDSQPQVDFFHPDIAIRLESTRHLMQREECNAKNSPDHETGVWSPEKAAHVEAIIKAIVCIDNALRAMMQADQHAMTRMKKAKTPDPINS